MTRWNPCQSSTLDVLKRTSRSSRISLDRQRALKSSARITCSLFNQRMSSGKSTRIPPAPVRHLQRDTASPSSDNRSRLPHRFGHHEPKAFADRLLNDERIDGRRNDSYPWHWKIGWHELFHRKDGAVEFDSDRGPTIPGATSIQRSARRREELQTAGGSLAGGPAKENELRRVAAALCEMRKKRLSR